MTQTPPTALDLADWRRQIASLYAQVREMKDPKESWAHWRAVRSRLFKHHPMSPIPEASRARFEEIECFPYNSALRFVVDVAACSGPVAEVPLGGDGVMQQRPVARTMGLSEALGGELTLYWIDGYGGGLFLPFKDASCGKETYGAGRYLIDSIKSADLGQAADGRLILDFNFAYHPSCALNPDYICPLAPAENTLPRPVHGGEKLGPGS